ncbi:MAG: dienelactone hydrolase family protein [Desulfomonilaceae bacterium]
MNIVGRVAFLLTALLLMVTGGFAFSYRAEIPLPGGGCLPGYCFVPRHGIKAPVPGVIVGVGVGSTKILQYHDYCQCLADRNFFVVLIDPSNFPEALVPGPFSWEKGPGRMVGDINQAVVAGKLAITSKWYLNSIRGTVDYLCMLPMVDRTRLVLTGHSQPANAALTYASQDRRIKAIVWNYGGSPWVMPYEPLRLPPVLIFHGDADEVYDVKYARKLIFELHTHGRFYEAYIYPHQKHMFNVLYDLQTENRFMKPVIVDAFERLISFLCRVLQNPSP